MRIKQLQSRLLVAATRPIRDSHSRLMAIRARSGFVVLWFCGLVTSGSVVSGVGLPKIIMLSSESDSPLVTHDCWVMAWPVWSRFSIMLAS